ncbi:MAG: 1-acyl-sn-glycerol-3-phosphate acyltransferase [Patescibacteria group bacterium]
MTRQLQPVPEFSVEHFEPIYANVQQTWQNPDRAQLYHKMAGTLLKPNVNFGLFVQEQMQEHIGDGGLCAIAFTHGSVLDPLHIAAMAQRNQVFEPLIGKTMIGAKAGLFTAPIVKTIVPDLGAVPVWRHKDVIDEDRQSQEEQQRLREIRKQAGRAFIQTQIAGINTGHHMAMHVEGTRNKDKPMQIQQVQAGFGEVVAGVDQNVKVLIMTAAFYYGTGKNKTKRKPTMFVDIPVNQGRSEPEEVRRTITPSLQTTLDQAIALHA